ncbi:MAG: carboxyl transferase domain-containing protein, partial [Myxococcota bacterium]
MSNRLEDLRSREAGALEGGGSARVRAQHEKGKLTARERLELLLDEGSFEETDMLVTHRSTDFGLERQRYLGDGVVTGGLRDLASLRGKLAGKAIFVGLAVGDGADVPSLGTLADDTGGLVVPIDPADDLSWRALDAIATLYTPRVTGLIARVVDAAGRPVEGAVAHLRAGTLAEGDEVEVVVRAPAKAEVRAVEVTGERGGAAWSHRIELGSASQVERAGYAPRLWAQRQVQSLILARNATGGLPEEERVAQREALRKEIVELGKRFFLLSPHTSLIVLENDRMYAEYGVTKGKNDGWAGYVVPQTIEVVRGGVM